MKSLLITLAVGIFYLVFLANACNAHGLNDAAIESLDGSESPRDLRRVMRDISREYQQTIMKTPYVSPAVYVEKAKCANSYCMFTEGEGILYSDGYDTLIEVGNFTFISEMLYKSDRTDEWYEYMPYTMAIFPELSSRSDIQLNSGALFSAFRFFEINGPLTEYRDFSYERVEAEDDHSLAAISFDSSQRAGVIYYNSETNLPMKIELERIPFYSITHQRWVRATGYVNFELFENKLFVTELFFNYKREDMDFYAALNVDSPIDHNLEQMDKYLHSRIRANINNPFIEEITDLELFESNFEIVNMADLRRDLEMEKSLEEQFQDNSGAPFFYMILSDGTKTLGHEGEKMYETTREFRDRFVSRSKEESFQPKLKIQDRWKDFGKVQTRTPLVAEYTMVNKSGNVVNILSVNPACVFNNYEIDQKAIEPGQSATLSVYLTPSFNGYLKEYIIIETDTDERFYSLVFEADIE
ncbi:MAG: DUF1573 domain-containing protein [Balneolia bacterium]|nr:DUF1573 domain-containing protein [Balneolia bacterium]